MKENIMKALVVDDNEVNTLVLSNMLELFDVEVNQANYGMKALEMVHDKQYNIIFIDHVMPGMDGVQTTKAIRELAFGGNLIIIALTSSITDEIRRQYSQVGANEVYSKPLGLTELAAILKHWCPQLSFEEKSGLERGVEKSEEDSRIKQLIKEISGINYEVGLRYAMGDQANYFNILKVSLKDIRTCINLIIRGYDNKQPKDVHIGVHNMKSVFANIGATELAYIARDFEHILLSKDITNSNQYDSPFFEQVQIFYEKLRSIIEQYDTLKNELLHEELPNLPMAGEEYEQSLVKVIYYIKRFDYTAILDMLDLLIRRGRPEYRTMIEQALAHIKDFQYEGALVLLEDIKKEMELRAISTDTNL